MNKDKTLLDKYTIRTLAEAFADVVVIYLLLEENAPDVFYRLEKILGSLGTELIIIMSDLVLLKSYYTLNKDKKPDEEILENFFKMRLSKEKALEAFKDYINEKRALIQGR